MLVDETDLALVHALQIAPRAPWSELSAVLGIDAGTAARRWSRLRDEGVAWVSVVPSPERGHQYLVGAVVMVRCPLERLETTAAELSRHPWVFGVERVSSEHPLVLEVLGLSYDHLGDTFAALHRVPGVQAVEHRVIGALVSEGGVWRLDALTASQRHRLSSSRPSVSASSTRAPSDRVIKDVTACLRHDARAGVPEIARHCGVSPSTARRQLAQVLASGAVRLRVDLAQPATGFPVRMTAWWQVPVRDLRTVSGELAAQRTTRLLAHMATGPANLALGSWLRQAADVVDADLLVESMSPAAQRVDRVMTLRTYKRAGRLMTAAGLAGEAVPLEL